MRTLFAILISCVSVMSQDSIKISRVQFSSDARLIVEWTSIDSGIRYVQISKSRSFDSIEAEDSTRDDSIEISFEYDLDTIYYCRVRIFEDLWSKAVAFRTFSERPSSIRLYRVANVHLKQSIAIFTLRGQVFRDFTTSNISVSKLSKNLMISSF